MKTMENRPSEASPMHDPARRQEIIDRLRGDKERYPDLADDIDFLLGRVGRPVTDSVEAFLNRMTITIIRRELRKRGSSTLG